MPKGKAKISQEVADAVFRKQNFMPLEPYEGSNVKRKSKCEVCGDICFVTYTSVRIGQRGCRTCKGKLMRQARLVDSEIVDKVFAAAKLEPLEPYKGANVGRKSKCVVCGTIGKPRYSTIRNGHLGCKPCGYKIVREKLMAQKTNLAAIDAVFARANLTPLEAWINANTPRLSQCNSCGNQSKVHYSGLWNGQGGCRPCAAKERGRTQLLPESEVNEVFKRHNLEPLDPYNGSSVRRRCRCLTCGSIVSTLCGEIASGKRSGCRYCGYKKLGQNKTLPAHLVDALFASKDLEPLEPYKGAVSPRRCRCLKCGREVSPQYNSLKQGQGGCKYCAPVGLKRSAPGVLYLMEHEAFCAIKVGVTSKATRRDRIKAHQNSGWSLAYTWDLEDAGLAEAIETVVLSHWRKSLGAPPALLASDMPQGGYSETIAKLYTTVNEASTLIDVLVAETHKK